MTGMASRIAPIAGIAFAIAASVLLLGVSALAGEPISSGEHEIAE